MEERAGNDPCDGLPEMVKGDDSKNIRGKIVVGRNL